MDGYYTKAYHQKLIESNADSAISTFQIAAGYYLKIQDSSRYATCLLRLAGIYGEQFRLQTALEYALKAKDTIEGKSNLWQFRFGVRNARSQTDDGISTTNDFAFTKTTTHD